MFLSPVAASTRFTSIRDRIDTINVDYFRELFEYCSGRFSKQLANNKTMADAAGTGTLLRFDSTMIALSAKLFGEQMGGMRAQRPTRRR